MIYRRTCKCGNMAHVRDLDELAICADCKADDDKDVRAAESWRNQVGAQWLAHDRFQRDNWYGT